MLNNIEKRRIENIINKLDENDGIGDNEEIENENVGKNSADKSNAEKSTIENNQEGIEKHSNANDNTKYINIENINQENVEKDNSEKGNTENTNLENINHENVEKDTTVNDNTEKINIENENQENQTIINEDSQSGAELSENNLDDEEGFLGFDVFEESIEEENLFEYRKIQKCNIENIRNSSKKFATIDAKVKCLKDVQVKLKRLTDEEIAACSSSYRKKMKTKLENVTKNNNCPLEACKFCIGCKALGTIHKLNNETISSAVEQKVSTYF